MGIATLAVALAPAPATRRPGAMRWAAAAALAGLGLLAGAGTVAGQEGGHGGVPGPAADPPPAGRSISVNDRTVVPFRAVVGPGTEVTWRNDGFTIHTVTETEERWDSGSLGRDETFSIRAPAETGDYRYYCRFHPSIRGVLTVSPLEFRGPASVAYRTRAGLVGVAPGAAPGTPVSVERRVPGRWVQVAVTETDDIGAFGASTPRLESGGAFRAVVGDLISPGVRIGVEPLVAVTLRRGVVRAQVQPGRAGAAVVLQRLSLESYTWTAVGRTRLSAGRTARIRVPGPGVYRVRVPRAAPRLVEGVSRAVEHRPGHYRDR